MPISCIGKIVVFGCLLVFTLKSKPEFIHPEFCCTCTHSVSDGCPAAVLNSCRPRRNPSALTILLHSLTISVFDFPGTYQLLTASSIEPRIRVNKSNWTLPITIGVFILSPISRPLFFHAFPNHYLLTIWLFYII